MKKKITMAAAVLAVSAMATSAFAAEPVAQKETIPAKTLVAAQVIKAPQAISFEEFAKEQGVTVDELLEQMEKDGLLAQLAKMKALSLEEMKNYLKEEGKVVEAFAILPAQIVDGKEGDAKEISPDGKTAAMKMTIAKLAEADKDGGNGDKDETGTAVPFTKTVTIKTSDIAAGNHADDKTAMVKITRSIPAVNTVDAAEGKGQMAAIVLKGNEDLAKMAAVTVSLSLEDAAKSQGLTADELLAKMEKDGSLAEIAKSKNMTTEEAIDYLKKDAKFAEAAVMIPAKKK
ncbi:hypothetical protein ACTID9_02255 [Brevibacillus fluminis]|uniref:hypothetical protein n=1 Tax=Brevibacillus fluminis TaxID=511487 RepID=UPI003F8A0D03